MKPTSVLLLLILSLTTYLPAANNALAGESQMNVAAIGSSDGTIKIGLPDRWNLDKKNENASFWWANFVDSRRDANIFVSMERKIGYGYRHPLLDDWGKDFAEKQIKRYAGNYSYEIRGITKKTATLGSGQIVEFSIYKLSINGNWREVVKRRQSSGFGRDLSNSNPRRHVRSYRISRKRNFFQRLITMWLKKVGF